MTPPCRIPGCRLQAQLPHSTAMTCHHGWPLWPALTEGRGWHQLYAWFPQRGSEMFAELMQKKKENHIYLAPTWHQTLKLT